MHSTVSGFCVAVLLSISSSVHAQSATDDIKAKAQRLVAPLVENRDARLHAVATFDHQVTGATVAPDGRIFVNFPRWTEDAPVSVAELMPDGSTKPYPDEEWNAWRNAQMSEVSPNDHFVCVQSVVADRRGSLWVVDLAAPNAEKTVKGGPKIVEIDLKSNNVKRAFPIGPDVAGPASYLNDIRIAPDGRFAYLTDSGSPGGLVVLDIQSGQAWRVLSDDPSTGVADPKRLAERSRLAEAIRAVTQLSTSTLLLLSTLNNVFLQEKASTEVNDTNHRLWRIRFENARQRLQEAGISVTDDLQRSLQSYMEQRKRWDHLIRILGSSTAYQPSEIDTATH
jgi:hypothetical protein